MSPLFISTFFVSAVENILLPTINNVESVTQDSKGFIWFAGQQGLTRYDGKELLSFSNHNSKWLLPFTWTHHIELINDKLLVSTESKGVWWFDPNKGIASPLNISLNDNSVYRSTYFKGKYYIFSDKIYVFDNKAKKTTRQIEQVKLRDFIKTKDSLYFFNSASLNLITDIGYSTILTQEIKAVESLGDILVVVKKDHLQTYKSDSLISKKTLSYNVRAITKAFNSSDFFVLDDQGYIHKYNQDLIPIEHNFPQVLMLGIDKIFHDDSNVIWYFSGEGVSKISAQHINNKPFYFNARVNAIKLENYQNEIVIGSYGDGLHPFNNDSQLFTEEIKAQLQGKNRRITDLQQVGEDLYIATFGGLWVYRAREQSLKKVPFKENNQLLLDISLINNLLYLATDGNGFISFDLKSQKVVQIIDKNNNFSSPEVIDSLGVRNNSVWFATAEGIDVYNKITKSITNIVLPGSSKIISLINTQNKIFAFSKGSGVFILNYTGEVINQLGKGIDFGKAKLINDEIWAPSRRGLFRINPDTLEILLVPNTEKYSFTSEPVMLNDNIYIGHYGGVVTIPHKKTISYNPYVYISKTTVSGKSSLLNKEINIDSANDVIQLDLASLDFRSGQNKQFKYQINNGIWYPINGHQLTLTGLASGSYYLNIMGTNSLGQWSKKHAFTQIHVAYPWYWTPKIRVLYALFIIILLAVLSWLLYLRGRSISHIHTLLADDIKTRGKTALNVSRNLSHVLSLYDNFPQNDNNEHSDNQQKIKELLEESVKELSDKSQTNVPDNLYGNSLAVALPYLADFVHNKYHINIDINQELNDDNISYELQSDIYTMIYEAIISAILNGNGRNFKISLQEFKNKIWLTITDDGDSFTHFKSKINFDMAMYYIRQIANKHTASVNTFAEQNQGSQLVISIPLMQIS